MWILCILALAFFAPATNAFRILSTSTQKPNGTYFKPNDRGFVGVYGEPSNYQRERINEGAFETSEQELFYEGVSPRQACPNMVGPFSDGNYYCSAREFGFCDRRSGTCFCNTGYQGIDCSECQDSYFKIGSHCYPKKLCPNDCSGAGTCNYNNGTCSCLPHRTGTMCETLLCSIHSPLCVTCTVAECLQCSGGYYLSGDANVCRSCYDFDPRCAGCIKEEGCTVCADSTLTSVRRSGYRVSDPALPEEELKREFSITIPFGSKSPESFADAESYFVTGRLGDTPLRNKSIICSQGLHNDAEWTCSPYPQSHVVCGHFGVFTLLYPNYSILESAKHIRMFVQRSGGGYGNVTINYFIKHYTTNDSDVVATAAYTTAQQLSFPDGVVQRSFLISILDDNIVEENEVFQVVLETPEGGGSVGAQFRANVTIVDDDSLKTSPKLTKLLQNTTTTIAGEPFSVFVQAVAGNGNPQTLGGDKFFALFENDLSSWLSPIYNDSPHQRQSTRKRCTVKDFGNGKYEISTSSTEQGVYQLRVWHAFPNSIKGEYFYDAYFENIAVTRLDHAVNFTWGSGRLIPRGTDYISIRWSGAILTPAEGLYRFKVQADDHARLWIDGDLLLDHFHERAVNTEASRAIYLPGNELIEVVLEYREVNGDAFAVFMWQPPGATSLDVVPQSALFSLFEVDRSPVLVSVRSTVTAANHTECIGDGLYSGVAHQMSSFSICPEDYFGNMRDDEDVVRLRTEHFSSSLRLVYDAGFHGVGSEYVAPTLTYNENTHCFDAFYTPERAGTYELSVVFASHPDDTPEHVKGSPFIVDIAPSSSSGPHSLIWGLDNPLYAQAGECYSFTIVMRDRAENLRLVGGDSIQAYTYRVDYFNETAGLPNSLATYSPTMHPTAMPSNTFLLDKASDTFASSSVIRYGTVRDLGNGNYSVRLCPVIAGVHEIHILLKGKGVSNQSFRILDRSHSLTEPLGMGTFSGQYIHQSPYKMVVQHAQASIISTTAEGSGLKSATVGEPASFKITVRDAFDNVLRTAAFKPRISLTLDRSPNAWVHVWDYQNGSYLMQYIAQKAGVNLVSVFIDGFQIQGSPFSVFTLDGNTSANYSYAFGPGLHTGVAGELSYFQLRSLDLGNNPKNSLGDLYTFVVTGANSLAGVMAPCPAYPEEHLICGSFDSGVGFYWGSFLPSFSGTIQIRIFLQKSSSQTVEISNSPFTAFISPTDPQAERTDISGTLYDIEAGQTARVLMQTRDKFGNKLTTGGWKIELAILGVGVRWGTELPYSSDQGMPNKYNYKGLFYGYPNYYGSLTDNTDGQYAGEYKVDRSGMYVLRLSIAERGLNVTYFNGTNLGHLFDRSFDSRQFIESLQGRAVNYGSAISWTGDIGGFDSRDGSKHESSYQDKYLSRRELTIDIASSTGSRPPMNTTGSGNGLSLVNFRQNYWSATWTGMITAPFPETYKFVIDLDDQSEANLWIGGVGVETNRSYLGEHVLNITLLERRNVAFYNFSDTHSREFLLEMVHFTGDYHLRLYWESLSTPFSLVPESAFSHWRNMSHFNLTVHPTTLCSRCSTAFGASLHNARVAEEQFFTLYSRDIYGNLMQRGGDQPTVFAVGDRGVAFRGRVVDYGNSTYLVRYFPTISGIFRLYVTMGCCAPNAGVGVQSEIEQVQHILLQGAPFTLTVESASLRASHSTSAGSGLVGGIAGQDLAFSVFFRDMYDNPTTVSHAENVSVQVVFRDVRNGDLVLPAFLNISLTEQNVTVQYAMNKAGRYNMSVSFINKEEGSGAIAKAILGSPFLVSISPSSPTFDKTICRGLGMRQAQLDAGNDASFELQLYDSFVNKIDVGGDKFFLRVNGDANFASSSLPVVPFCYDASQGSYLCFYRPLYRRPHRLVVKLLRRNPDSTGGTGLIGEYFTSFNGAHFDMQVEPVSTKLDSQIKFTWNEGFLSSNTSQDPIQSIRWTGFLVSPLSTEFNISVQAQGLDISLFIDEGLVFDQGSSDATPRVSKMVMLQADSSYSIRIVARVPPSRKFPLLVNLGWSTNTIPFHSISQAYLFPSADEIPLSPFLVNAF